MFDNFAKYAVDNGGKIKPLIVPSSRCGGRVQD